MADTSFPDKVAATIERHGLLRKGDLVLVAVSGGPDSMALLHALFELRDRFGVQLMAASLDHMLRRRASAADALFATGQARSLGLPNVIGEADVRAEQRKHGGSVEMAARRERYAFFERVATHSGATKVALGHTADDQAETILLRLLRGGELAALRGMPIARPLSPTSSATLIRPLLDVTRAEVLGYLAARNIPWRSDATNADRAFLRNWVRHELLPLLEARDANVRAALLGAVERARVLFDAVGAQASRLVAAGDEGARLDPARLAEEPRLIRSQAIRHAYAAAGGTGDLTRRALDAAEALLASPSGRSVSLAGGLIAERGYDALVLHPRPGAPPQVAVTLAVPGRVEIPEVGLWVEATPLICRRPAVHCRPAPQKDRWEEVVDLDSVGDVLGVRTRRPGDRFVPLGQSDPTKLKDFLIGQRVPRAERDRLLLVEGEAGIAWVVGLRLDNRARVTHITDRVARLRAGRL